MGSNSWGIELWVSATVNFTITWNCDLLSNAQNIVGLAHLSLATFVNIVFCLCFVCTATAGRKCAHLSVSKKWQQCKIWKLREKFCKINELEREKKTKNETELRSFKTKCCKTRFFFLFCEQKTRKRELKNEGIMWNS